MKKYYKIMYLISIIILLVGITLLGIDYYNYNPLSESSPFYTYIIIRSLEFILPSIIIFIIGIILKKK